MFADDNRLRGQQAAQQAATYSEKTMGTEALSGTSGGTTGGVATVLQNVTLPQDVTLEPRDLCDVEMLLSGAFAPLQGFLNYEDFCSCVTHCRLVSGLVWPIPIVLAVAKKAAEKQTIKEGVDEEPTAKDSSTDCEPTKTVRLRDSLGTVVAILTVESCYEPNLEAMCLSVLGTTDDHHPYVAYVKKHHANCVYVGGKVEKVHGVAHFDFCELRRSPADVKAGIARGGWDVVVGFQTRNPMHRSHFELTLHALRCAQAAASGNCRALLLLTPACGPTQSDDIRYHIRVRCYKHVLPFYAASKIEVALVLLPLAMRLAGPREAIWHALIRKNFGCTHFIVGRDHAGPSARRRDGRPFYGPYEAHSLVERFQSEIGIVPIFGRNVVYVGEDLGGFLPEDCVLPGVQPKQISGTDLRNMLSERRAVPEWYSFKPVIEELQKLYKRRTEQGFCLYFTGLPCSGKSTLATAVEAALQERDTETRQVTLLDADVVRTHLSQGLGFTRHDRQCNVRRIGYVAGVVVLHGGVCIVANIAPYEEDRRLNRQLVTDMGGGYIEVYVSTPLEVCEKRDVKELYKKARAGFIKQFTGVSDPYEVPTNPELVIDSSSDVTGKVDRVLQYLMENGWVHRPSFSQAAQNAQCGERLSASIACHASA